jgi:Sulfotransferase family
MKELTYVPLFAAFCARTKKEIEEGFRHRYAMDSHWRSYEDLCHPCFVGYDFIGKHETMSDDVDHVLKLIGAYGRVQFPSSRSPTSGYSRSRSQLTARTANASLVRGYRDVPVSDISRLVALYDDDYLMFGYPRPAGIPQSVQAEGKHWQTVVVVEFECTCEYRERRLQTQCWAATESNCIANNRSFSCRMAAVYETASGKPADAGKFKPPLLRHIPSAIISSVGLVECRQPIGAWHGVTAFLDVNPAYGYGTLEPKMWKYSSSLPFLVSK